MKIDIRDADLSDCEIIAAFNSAMAMETERRELDPDLIRDGVLAVLNDTARGRYWIADIDGRTVGQIMVTYEWSDWRNGTFWWIQSVYVHPDFRRQGVFAALYRHVESLSRAAGGVCGLRLYVEDDNTRAQQTYRALGMTNPGYRVMEVDYRKSE